MRINFKKLLLENLGVRQVIFKNTFWLAVSEGVSRLLKLILIIYVARILGATEYGKFTFALAFITLFAVFSDFGLSQITTRELSREKEKEKEYPAILSLKLLLNLGALILILASSFFITPDPTIQKVIWILGIYIIIDSFAGIIYAFLRARQIMEYEAFAKILQAIVVVLAGFFVILNFPSVVNLSYSYLFTSLVVLIFILIFFHFKVFPLGLSWDSLVWKKFLSMSWPLALGGIFGAIYVNIDSIMMGCLGQITQTGWYNSASKIVKVTLIPAALISTSFFPVLSKFFKESRERLQKTWDHYMQAMIFLAIPLMTGGVVLAPRIIDFVYDPSFSPSILVFQILIMMAGIYFICAPFSQILIASNQQKKTFWVMFFGAIINVILNLILIPKYSLYGAALATIITYSTMFPAFFYFTLNFTPINPLNFKIFSTFIGSLTAAILMYFVIIQPQVYNLNTLVSVLIGASIYLICFFFCRKLINQIILRTG